MMYHYNSKVRGIRKRHVASLLMALLVSTGCASISAPGIESDLVRSRAAVPFVTATHSDLTSLPQPRGVIRAAVYSFRDKTGQYKPNPSNNLSTAVTQGADSILLKALIDSKWFAPVERANLQNLLTERKILQSSSLEGGNADAALPPVAPAQVIFEGSVVSYDSNIHTGGAGVRLLGIGRSTAYREDRVSINLRLIDISNGLILHSVMSTKSILSRKLDNGIFSYVDADKILELEAGYTFNEPAHIAITEALESALINVISEGIVSGSIQLANPEDVSSTVFDRYISIEAKNRFLESVRAEQIELKKQIELSEYRDRKMRLERTEQAYWDQHGIENRIVRAEAVRTAYAP